MKLLTGFADQFDTTVRLKYSLKHHGDLTSKEEIAAFLAPFGALDVDSIVFSMKAKKSKKTGGTFLSSTFLAPSLHIFRILCSTNACYSPRSV